MDLKALFGSLTALVLIGCDIRTAEDHIRIANELEAVGDLDSALQHLDRAIARNPDHLWSRLERGVLRSAIGDHAGAIADDTEVLQRDQTNVTAYFNRSLARGRMKDHLGALSDLEPAMLIKSPGWNAQGSRSVHVIFERVDNPWVGARRPEFDIPMDDIAFAFALTYLELDSADKAYDWLSHCIDRSVHLSDCLYERGILLLNHGRVAEGCADLEQATAMKDDRALMAWGKHCK